MTAPTPADDQAWLDHVASLRRKKITLNDDEIWYLRGLVVADMSRDTPCVLPELHAEHERTGGTALAKLSDAHIDLTTPKETN